MIPRSERLIDALKAHYGHSAFGDRIRLALEAAGVDLTQLTVEDLAPFDHLHGGQKPATLQLARLAGITPGSRVADLGGGIGGPARTLAAEFGCIVDVVDLTEEFCRVGTWLTQLTRLENRVSFHHGSALQTPLAAGAYDVVWMQNSAMNIEDRRGLYAEVSRLLRPGARYALQEVMAGPGGPAFYPMNWAATAESSFLSTPDQVHRLIETAGFRELRWLDYTEEATADFRQRIGPPAGAPVRPAYTPDDLSAAITENGLRNRNEKRIVYRLGVFQKER
jgi:SAM-dependent methyltransferase